MKKRERIRELESILDATQRGLDSEVAHVHELTDHIAELEADLHNGTNLHTHPGMKALHDDIAELEADRDYYKEALEFVAENGSGSNVPDEWPVWAEEKLHQRRHQN